MLCTTCGAPAPEAARFCPSCGGALQIHTDERRIVTVVFADIVGFTTLAESRDPEAVKAFVDRCFSRLAADVTAHGGRVDKVVGDGMVALFGAPIAHEDDPERAVRAALAMQDTAQELCEETGIALRLRIGVNTGEVLVGGLRAGGDYTALGDVVNIASRLQTSAEPGQVLVGPETHEATHEAIRYSEAETLQTRGREQPVEAYVAIEPLTLPGRRPRRSRAPLIGRDHELGLLRQSVSNSVFKHRPQLLVVVGDAGVGKSRLIEELTAGAAAEHGAVVLRGRCLPYGEANPFWPVAEALREAIGTPKPDSPQEKDSLIRGAIADVMGLHPDAQETGRLTDGFLYLMGGQTTMRDVDPQRARADAFRSLATVLERYAARHPVMIVLSELHWADPTVLELIDYLLDKVRGVPVMLVATARHELRDRWTPAPGRHDLVLLNLDPLDALATADLAAALLGGDVPEGVLEVLVERSGGNPLFVEELSSLLMGEAADPGDLPSTLRGLVSARLDALDPGARDVLAGAAVVGQGGAVDALQVLAPDTDVQLALDSLCSSDLLEVRDGRFSFRSELVREVTYGTLTRADRAARHARLGAWYAAAEEEHPEETAHHFSVAAATVRDLGAVEGVPHDVTEHALAALERAVDRAETQETIRASILLMDRMLDLLDPSDPRRLEVRARRAGADASRRHLEDARRDAEAVLTEAGPADARARARATTVLGDVLHKERHQQEAIKTLRVAVEQWREAADRRGEADALRLLGLAYLFSGQADKAESTVMRALDLAHELEDRRGVAWALQHLAWSAFQRGESSKAERWLNEAAQVFSEIGDWRGLAWVFGLFGWVRLYQGRLGDAESFADMVLAEAVEYGDKWAEAITLLLLASVHLWTGRTTSAIEQAERSRGLFREIGDPWGEVQGSLVGVRALVLAGRVPEARLRLDQARAAAKEAADQTLIEMGLMVQGSVDLMLGDPRSVVSASEDMDDRLGLGRDRHLEVEAGVALALLQLGRITEAIELLATTEADATDPGLMARLAGLTALAYASDNRPRDAVAAAAGIADVEGGTYSDRVLAETARALAHAQLGEAEMAHRSLADAETILRPTGDVLHRTLLQLARGVVLGSLDDPGADAVVSEARTKLIDIGLSPPAWERAFSAAAARRTPA